jgi:hypothetical protein
MAACRLSRLPADFSALVPNLRVLNLNYNFFDDVKPLEGLRRLNKLTIIGSRLKGTKGIIKVLKGCTDVEMVDFRYVFVRWLIVICIYPSSLCSTLVLASFVLDLAHCLSIEHYFSSRHYLSLLGGSVYDPLILHPSG